MHSDVRRSWDDFFMTIASTFAQQSTCLRKKVGCVLVRDKHVISAGYNGSLPGLPHCTDVGCLFLPETTGCQRTSHAEASALAQAAKHGHSVVGCTAYVTLLPCRTCLKLLIMAGISKVIYLETYRTTDSIQLAEEAGITMIQHTSTASVKLVVSSTETPS